MQDLVKNSTLTPQKSVSSIFFFVMLHLLVDSTEEDFSSIQEQNFYQTHQ